MLVFAAWSAGVVGFMLAAAGGEAWIGSGGAGRAVPLLFIAWGLMADWVQWARGGRLLGRSLERVTFRARWLLLPHAPGETSPAPLSHSLALVGAIVLCEAWWPWRLQPVDLVMAPFVLGVVLGLEAIYQKRGRTSRVG